MMIVKLTFIGTLVCMHACVGIHMKRGIIVSPTSVKGRIWTLTEYDDMMMMIYIYIYHIYMGRMGLLSRSEGNSSGEGKL